MANGPPGLDGQLVREGENLCKYRDIRRDRPIQGQARSGARAEFDACLGLSRQGVLLSQARERRGETQLERSGEARRAQVVTDAEIKWGARLMDRHAVELEGACGSHGGAESEAPKVAKGADSKLGAERGLR